MEQSVGIGFWGDLNGFSNVTKKWGWVFAIGSALLLLGIFAGAYVFVATLTSVIVLGYCVFFGGVLHTVSAFWMKGWSGFFLELLLGVFSIVVGLILIGSPLAAGAGITLLLAVYFMVEGAFRFGGALVHSFPGRGFGLFSGTVTFILGWMVYRGWPASSIWVLGTFLSIRLLFSGIGMVALSWQLRRLHQVRSL